MQLALDQLDHLDVAGFRELSELRLRQAGDPLEVDVLRAWLNTSSSVATTRLWTLGGKGELEKNLYFDADDPFEATGKQLRATLACLIIMADKMDMFSVKDRRIPTLCCARVVQCVAYDDVRVKVAAVSLLRWAIENFPGPSASIQLLELPFAQGFDIVREMLRNRLCNGEALHLIAALLGSPKLPRGRYNMQLLHWRHCTSEYLFDFVDMTEPETASPSLADALQRFMRVAFEEPLLNAYRQRISHDPRTSLSLLDTVHRALWPNQRRPQQLLRWRALMCSHDPLVNLGPYGALGTDCFVYWCSVFRSQVLALVRSQMVALTKGSSFFWIDYAFSRLLRVLLQCTLLKTPRISMPWLVTGDDSFFRVTCFTVAYFLRCMEATPSFEDSVEAVHSKLLLVIPTFPRSPEEYFERMVQRRLDQSDDSTSIFGGSGSDTWTDSERDERNFAAPQPPHVRYFRLSRFFGAAVPRGGAPGNAIPPHFNPNARHLRLTRFFGARPMLPPEPPAVAPAVGPQPQHVRQHRLQKLLGEDLPASLWNNEERDGDDGYSDGQDQHFHSWSSEEDYFDQEAVEEFSATTATWEDFSADSDATTDSQLKRWDSFTILY